MLVKFVSKICMAKFVSKICMGKFVSEILYGDFVWEILLRNLLTNFVWAKYMVVQVHKSIGYTSSISESGFLRWDLEIGLVERICMVKFVW